MSNALRITALVAVTLVAGSNLVGQGVLAQLGLAEGAARDFLFDEVKTQRQDHPFARRHLHLL